MSDRFEAFLESIKNQERKESFHKEVNDYLEKKFEELIPIDIRKKYGQFSTPLPLARLMALWGHKIGSIKTVLDPAVGCGILVRQVLACAPEEAKVSHVLCFDIDPLMLKATNYSLSRWTSLRIEFKQEDFLFSTPL
ncbi:MAG: hypothetical protein ACFFBD_16285, partial [Candidatus Hodarchaeota archaeon]